MRPVRLEIEGLRSFRTKEVIEFTGRDYIAVIGDTGAGKSSILEALTFALYGRTTFSGHGHQELMNSLSTMLRVVLAFDVGGEHWEVSRTLRRATTGKVSTGESSLRRFDDDGMPVESFEKARDVTTKVESVLGLDIDAFLRTVVLPQGQFSRLLVDDDQKLRSGVLRQIWRTDELTAAGTLASDALAELGPLVGRVEQALAGEPDDPDAHLAMVQAEVTRCEAALEDSRDRQATAERAVTAVVDASKQIARADQITSHLAKWDGPAMRAAARTVDAADRAWAEAVTETQQNLEASRAALAALPTDDDGYSLAEVGTFGALLRSLPGLASRRDSADAEAETAQRELDALAARVASASAAAATASGELHALETARGELVARVTTAEARLGPAQAALRDVRRSAASAVDAEKSLEAAEAALVERTSTLDAARVLQSEAESTRADAVTRFESAQRAAAAAEAGHGLHGGDPCPVCDRKLPASWTPPDAPELDSARAALAAANDRREAATTAVTKAEGLAHAAATALADARVALVAVREAETAALEALAASVGAAADLDHTDDDLLSGLVDAIAAERHALDEHDGQLAHARQRHASLGNEHAAAEASHRAKHGELAAARERRDAAHASYAGELARVPDPLRPSEHDLSAEVARSIAALDARRGVLEAREAGRATRRREVDELVARRQQLDDAHKTDVDAPADRLWQAVVAHRSVLDRAADELAATVDLPAIESKPAVNELGPCVELATHATDALSTAAHASVADARAASQTASRVLEGFARELQLDADDADAIVAAVKTQTEEAALDHRTARATADTFAKRMPAVAEVREAGAALAACYLALADLAAALRDGAFPKWLTLRRSRSLLVHASRLLSEMTAGRYAFADLDDDDSQWHVFDSDTGQPRSPSSLSGGEKFLASLSLALGMVEMMGRQGDRIEALFLDEGFAALDRTNLDAAVEALSSVAATGRLVTVITHLRAVAEQIDNVLLVTREPGGTRTAWLDSPERSELAEVDATLSSGLLE